MTDAEKSAEPLQAHFEQTIHYPATTFGYGSTNQVAKVVNICHGIMMHCGCEEVFLKHRREVRVWTSDQGVETLVADSACPTGEHVSDPAEVAEIFDVSGDHGKNAEAYNKFLFPRCLRMPDHGHMIFNLMGESLEQTPQWPEFKPHLKAIAAFLDDRGLRSRFQVLCLAGPLLKKERDMFNE